MQGRATKETRPKEARPKESGPTAPRVLIAAIAAVVAIAFLMFQQNGNRAPSQTPQSAHTHAPSKPESADDSQPNAAEEASTEEEHGPPDSETATKAKQQPESSQDDPRPRSDSHVRRDLGRLFAMAPVSIRAWQLDRHVDLNVRDTPLIPEQQQALAALLEQQKELLLAQENRLGEKRAEVMMDLLKRDQLRPLTLASLTPEARKEVLELARQRDKDAATAMQTRRQQDPSLMAVRDRSHLSVAGALKQLGRKFVPNASAFVLHQGVLHMATDQQMEVLSEEVLSTHAARRHFLHTMLAWFVEQTLTTPEKASLVAERFEYWIRKV